MCPPHKEAPQARGTELPRRTLHMHSMPSGKCEFKGTKYETPVYGWHRVPSTAHIRRRDANMSRKVPYGHNLARMTVGWGRVWMDHFHTQIESLPPRFMGSQIEICSFLCQCTSYCSLPFARGRREDNNDKITPVLWKTSG